MATSPPSSPPSSAPPSQRLRTKCAIVTASTAGIGLYTALRLLQEGATVLISSRKQSSVDKAVEFLARQPHVDSSRVKGVVCHVGSGEHLGSLVDEAVGWFARCKEGANETGDTKLVDIVVSNAAVNPSAGPILDTDSAVIDKVLDINVKSAIELVKRVRPHLAKSASIVFISSYTAYNPSPPIGMYAISKTALLGLTRALAEELGGTEDRIRVNAVAPGIVPTNFSQALVANEESRSWFVEKTMLKRLGRAEDIAGVVAFLASEDAGYVTGECVLVAGGMVASRL